MNVLLAAEEAAGAQALKLVAGRGHTITGVLTTGAPRNAPAISGLAREIGAAVLDPSLVRDAEFATWVVEHQVDLFVNVHSLHIAAPAVLAAPRVGSFNLHPGPLPGYAGLSTPSWAIFEGQTRHAVTLHWMTGEVDGGAVAYEAWFDIGPDDTGLKVATSCVRHGLPLLEHLLDDAAADPRQVPVHPQDPSGRRWCARAAPYGGQLPWQLRARQVVDLVRAASYAPFPSPWGCPLARLGGRELEIVRVTTTGEPASSDAGVIGARRSGGVLVATADEWVLVERLRQHGVVVDPANVLPAGHRFDLPPEPQAIPGPSSATVAADDSRRHPGGDGSDRRRRAGTGGGVDRPGGRGDRTSSGAADGRDLRAPGGRRGRQGEQRQRRQGRGDSPT
jgi:methionyl-tRNA formyltransferase